MENDKIKFEVTIDKETFNKLEKKLWEDVGKDEDCTKVNTIRELFMFDTDEDNCDFRDEVTIEEVTIIEEVVGCSCCEKNCVPDPDCKGNWLCPDKDCEVHTFE